MEYKEGVLLTENRSIELLVESLHLRAIIWALQLSECCSQASLDGQDWIQCSVVDGMVNYLPCPGSQPARAEGLYSSLVAA